MLFLSGNCPQYSVYKSFQTVKSLFLCQLYRFIAGCRIRNTVHKQNLIHSAAENITDYRFHFFHFYAGVLIQHIINANHVFQRSLHKPVNKCSVLFGKILHFIQRIADGNMTVFILLNNFQKDLKGYSSYIRFNRHVFFLRIK